MPTSSSSGGEGSRERENTMTGGGSDASEPRGIEGRDDEKPLIGKQLTPIIQVSSMMAGFGFLALTRMASDPGTNNRPGFFCLLASLALHFLTIGVGVQFQAYYIYVMDHAHPHQIPEMGKRFGIYLVVLTWTCLFGALAFILSVPLLFIEDSVALWGSSVVFGLLVMIMSVMWVDIYQYSEKAKAKQA